MAHASYLKEKARQLRTERKLTLDEITVRLALPRTTVYYWIRDIPIPLPTAKQSAAQRRASRAVSRRARERREAAYEEGRTEFETLVAEPTFTEFVTLFIAEGYKRTIHKVSIANSDPAVIVVSDAWLRRLSERPREYSVQYHADQSLDAIRRHWSSLVGVRPSEIKLKRKSNSNQLKGRTWRSEHGVLTVTVNDTFLRARMQAWVDEIRDRWNKLESIGA